MAAAKQGRLPCSHVAPSLRREMARSRESRKKKSVLTDSENVFFSCDLPTLAYSAGVQGLLHARMHYFTIAKANYFSYRKIMTTDHYLSCTVASYTH